MAGCEGCKRKLAIIKKRKIANKKQNESIKLYKEYFAKVDQEVRVRRKKLKDKCIQSECSDQETDKLCSFQIDQNKKFTEEIAKLRRSLKEVKKKLPQTEKSLEHVNFVNKQLVSFHNQNEKSLIAFKRDLKALLKHHPNSSKAKACLDFINDFGRRPIEKRLKDIIAKSDEAGVKKICEELLNNVFSPPSSLASSGIECDISDTRSVCSETSTLSLRDCKSGNKTAVAPRPPSAITSPAYSFELPQVDSLLNSEEEIYKGPVPAISNKSNDNNASSCDKENELKTEIKDFDKTNLELFVAEQSCLNTEHQSESANLQDFDLGNYSLPTTFSNSDFNISLFDNELSDFENLNEHASLLTNSLSVNHESIDQSSSLEQNLLLPRNTGIENLSGNCDSRFIPPRNEISEIPPADSQGSILQPLSAVNDSVKIKKCCDASIEISPLNSIEKIELEMSVDDNSTANNIVNKTKAPNNQLLSGDKLLIPTQFNETSLPGPNILRTQMDTTEEAQNTKALHTESDSNTLHEEKQIPSTPHVVNNTLEETRVSSTSHALSKTYEKIRNHNHIVNNTLEETQDLITLHSQNSTSEETQVPSTSLTLSKTSEETQDNKSSKAHSNTSKETQDGSPSLRGTPGENRLLQSPSLEVSKHISSPDEFVCSNSNTVNQKSSSICKKNLCSVNSIFNPLLDDMNENRSSQSQEIMESELNNTDYSYSAKPEDLEFNYSKDSKNSDTTLLFHEPNINYIQEENQDNTPVSPNKYSKVTEESLVSKEDYHASEESNKIYESPGTSSNTTHVTNSRLPRKYELKKPTCTDSSGSNSYKSNNNNTSFVELESIQNIPQILSPINSVRSMDDSSDTELFEINKDNANHVDNTRDVIGGKYEVTGKEKVFGEIYSKPVNKKPILKKSILPKLPERNVQNNGLWVLKSDKDAPNGCKIGEKKTSDFIAASSTNHDTPLIVNCTVNKNKQANNMLASPNYVRSNVFEGGDGWGQSVKSEISSPNENTYSEKPKRSTPNFRNRVEEYPYLHHNYYENYEMPFFNYPLNCDCLIHECFPKSHTFTQNRRFWSRGGTKSLEEISWKTWRWRDGHNFFRHNLKMEKRLPSEPVFPRFPKLFVDVGLVVQKFQSLALREQKQKHESFIFSNAIKSLNCYRSEESGFPSLGSTFSSKGKSSSKNIADGVPLSTSPNRCVASSPKPIVSLDFNTASSVKKSILSHKEKSDFAKPSTSNSEINVTCIATKSSLANDTHLLVNGTIVSSKRKPSTENIVNGVPLSTGLNIFETSTLKPIVSLDSNLASSVKKSILTHQKIYEFAKPSTSNSERSGTFVATIPKPSLDNDVFTSIFTQRVENKSCERATTSTGERSVNFKEPEDGSVPLNPSVASQNIERLSSSIHQSKLIESPNNKGSNNEGHEISVRCHPSNVPPTGSSDNWSNVFLKAPKQELAHPNVCLDKFTSSEQLNSTLNIEAPTSSKTSCDSTTDNTKSVSTVNDEFTTLPLQSNTVSPSRNNTLHKILPENKRKFENSESDQELIRSTLSGSPYSKKPKTSNFDNSFTKSEKSRNDESLFKIPSKNENDTDKESVINQPQLAQKKKLSFKLPNCTKRAVKDLTINKYFSNENEDSLNDERKATPNKSTSSTFLKGNKVLSPEKGPCSVNDYKMNLDKTVDLENTIPVQPEEIPSSPSPKSIPKIPVLLSEPALQKSQTDDISALQKSVSFNINEDGPTPCNIKKNEFDSLSLQNHDHNTIQSSIEKIDPPKVFLSQNQVETSINKANAVGIINSPRNSLSICSDSALQRERNYSSEKITCENDSTLLSVLKEERKIEAENLALPNKMQPPEEQESSSKEMKFMSYESLSNESTELKTEEHLNSLLDKHGIVSISNDSHANNNILENKSSPHEPAYIKNDFSIVHSSKNNYIVSKTEKTDEEDNKAIKIDKDSCVLPSDIETPIVIPSRKRISHFNSSNNKSSIIKQSSATNESNYEENNITNNKNINIKTIKNNVKITPTKRKKDKEESYDNDVIEKNTFKKPKLKTSMREDKGIAENTLFDNEEDRLEEIFEEMQLVGMLSPLPPSPAPHRPKKQKINTLNQLKIVNEVSIIDIDKLKLSNDLTTSEISQTVNVNDNINTESYHHKGDVLENFDSRAGAESVFSSAVDTCGSDKVELNNSSVHRDLELSSDSDSDSSEIIDKANVIVEKIDSDPSQQLVDCKQNLSNEEKYEPISLLNKYSETKPEFQNLTENNLSLSVQNNNDVTKKETDLKSSIIHSFYSNIKPSLIVQGNNDVTKNETGLKSSNIHSLFNHVKPEIIQQPDETIEKSNENSENSGRVLRAYPGKKRLASVKKPNIIHNLTSPPSQEACFGPKSITMVNQVISKQLSTFENTLQDIDSNLIPPFWKSFFSFKKEGVDVEVTGKCKSQELQETKVENCKSSKDDIHVNIPQRHKIPQIVPDYKKTLLFKENSTSSSVGLKNENAPMHPKYEIDSCGSSHLVDNTNNCVKDGSSDISKNLQVNMMQPHVLVDTQSMKTNTVVNDEDRASDINKELLTTIQSFYKESSVCEKPLTPKSETTTFKTGNAINKNLQVNKIQLHALVDTQSMKTTTIGKDEDRASACNKELHTTIQSFYKELSVCEKPVTPKSETTTFKTVKNGDGIILKNEKIKKNQGENIQPILQANPSEINPKNNGTHVPLGKLRPLQYWKEYQYENICNLELIDCSKDIFYSTIKFLESKIIAGEETYISKETPEEIEAELQMKVFIQKEIYRVMHSDCKFDGAKKIVKSLKNNKNMVIKPKSFARAVCDTIAAEKDHFSDEKPAMGKNTLCCCIFTMLYVGETQNDFLLEVLRVIEEVLGSYHDRTLSITFAVRMAAYYTAVCRAYSLDIRVKHLIIDIIYSRYTKACGIIFKILEMWPELLVYRSTAVKDDCILTQTIVSLLLSTNKDMLATKKKNASQIQQKYCSKNLRSHLRFFYGYTWNNFTSNHKELIEKCLIDIQYEEARKSLILICHCAPIESVISVVSNQMVPILEGWMNGNFSHHVALHVLVTTALIIRGMPLGKTMMFVNQNLLLFEKILHKSPDPIFAERVIEGIFYLRRHNIHLCFDIITHYSPTFKKMTKETIKYVRGIISASKLSHWLHIYKVTYNRFTRV